MAPSRYVGYLALFAGCLLPSGVMALWPIPTSLETGMTSLKVSPSFHFDVNVQNAPADLYEAVAQAQYYLENDKLGRLVVGRGVNDSAALASAKMLSSLTLSLMGGENAEPIASEAVKPLGTRREEYALTIPADGSAASLTANSTLGLYRGLTTFNQLFYYYGGVTYTLLAPISITDTPAYVSSCRMSIKVSAFKFVYIAFPRTWAGYIEELLSCH
jgi:hexosaminidase